MTFLTGCIFFGCAFRLADLSIALWARWGPTTTTYTLVDRHLTSSGMTGQILRSTPLYSASLSFTRRGLHFLQQAKRADNLSTAVELYFDYKRRVPL